jgi:hypothetical protein
VVDECVNGRVKRFPPALLNAALCPISESAAKIKLAAIKNMFNPIYQVKS